MLTARFYMLSLPCLQAGGYVSAVLLPAQFRSYFRVQKRCIAASTAEMIVPCDCKGALLASALVHALRNKRMCPQAKIKPIAELGISD